MKICSHCHKANPDDAAHCYQCGNPVSNAITLVAKRSIWLRIPSWAWIFIGLGAILLFILLIIGGFYSLANWEGFASLIFLLIGIFTFRVFSGQKPGSNSIIRAIVVGFFALMGATVDQTGNFLYNKPVEICGCPPGSSLTRTTEVSNPLPGRTDMTQNFTCWQNGVAVKQVDMFAVLGIRFLEYMLLAYCLIGLRWVIWKLKSARYGA